MFERPTGGERVLLVHIAFSSEDPQDEVQEITELAKSAGGEVIDTLVLSRKAPSAKYFITKGKAEEVKAVVSHANIELVIFNHSLSPTQERNLEALFECRVLDRIGLILDIFASRARTYEGKLQVELAQLKHIATRLVRGWTHLERQKGGIGLRGPGETQLETDRRLIRARIDTVKKRLEKVRSQRRQSREQRRRSAIPTVSLVGYTNAGKSTLFNILTHENIYVADQLFATLDPTLRQIRIPGIGAVVVTDTVGFIRDLPHELIAAFQATLEETQEADLLLQVIDAFDEAHSHHTLQVQKVLEEIKADEVPRLFVYNKIDLLKGSFPKQERDDKGQIAAVWLSAGTQQGVDLLTQAMAERLSTDYVYKTIELTPSQSAIRAKLYQRGVIHQERIDVHGNFNLVIRLPHWEYEQLLRELDEF